MYFLWEIAQKCGFNKDFAQLIGVNFIGGSNKVPIQG